MPNKWRKILDKQSGAEFKPQPGDWQAMEALLDRDPMLGSGRSSSTLGWMIGLLAVLGTLSFALVINHQNNQTVEYYQERKPASTKFLSNDYSTGQNDGSSKSLFLNLEDQLSKQNQEANIDRRTNQDKPESAEYESRVSSEYSESNSIVAKSSPLKSSTALSSPNSSENPDRGGEGNQSDVSGNNAEPLKAEFADRKKPAKIDEMEQINQSTLSNKSSVEAKGNTALNSDKQENEVRSELSESENIARSDDADSWPSKLGKQGTGTEEEITSENQDLNREILEDKAESDQRVYNEEDSSKVLTDSEDERDEDEEEEESDVLLDMFSRMRFNSTALMLDYGKMNRYKEFYSYSVELQAEWSLQNLRFQAGLSYTQWYEEAHTNLTKITNVDTTMHAVVDTNTVSWVDSSWVITGLNQGQYVYDTSSTILIDTSYHKSVDTTVINTEHPSPAVQVSSRFSVPVSFSYRRRIGKFYGDLGAGLNTNFTIYQPIYSPDIQRSSVSFDFLFKPSLGFQFNDKLSMEARFGYALPLYQAKADKLFFNSEPRWTLGLGIRFFLN